jgi:hypothetical protein
MRLLEHGRKRGDATKILSLGLPLERRKHGEIEALHGPGYAMAFIELRFLPCEGRVDCDKVQLFNQ